MSAHSPVAGRMSTSWPDARAFVGSVNKSLSVAASGPVSMRMLWQNTANGDRSIWLMNGASWDGSYAGLRNVPTAWSIAGAGDFNGDRDADILWQNTSTGDRAIWFMSGSTWPGASALLPNIPVQWSMAGVGDFNGDGSPDIVWQNTTTGDRSIWLMNGPNVGSYVLLPNVATVWSIAAVGDFDADRRPDLVWQNTATGDRSIWFMNGIEWAGGYALLPTVPTQWRIAAAANFDGDGNTDLVWQNGTTGERSIWLMNGSSWGGSYALLPTVSTQWDIADVLPTSFSYTVTGAWTCAVSVDCQDVYDVNLSANTKVTIAVTAVTGGSRVRLAAFNPGVPLSGTNLMTGIPSDRSTCTGVDNDSFSQIVKAVTPGVYRFAVGRQSGGSLPAGYTLTLTTDQAMDGQVQTISDAQSGLPHLSCGYDFATRAGWNCATSVSCQDVFDFETLEQTKVFVAVYSVTGASVVRIAAFDGGSVNTINTFTGKLADRMCEAANNGAAGETPTLPLGQHRFAIGRDWDHSAGTSGTYIVEITANVPLVDRGQTLNDTPSAFTTTSCP